MKLYKLTNEIADYWVLAEHPTEAENKLNKFLNINDYGFSSERKVTNIELIASQAENTKFLCGHYLLT